MDVLHMWQVKSELSVKVDEDAELLRLVEVEVLDPTNDEQIGFGQYTRSTAGVLYSMVFSLNWDRRNGLSLGKTVSRGMCC